MILCILQVLQISITRPHMLHLNEHPTLGNFRVFVACCTFYFCVGVTCRLVPVRRVGVQLYPAAHWQQKQRLSLEDSHIERLGFSPLLTFLRDSQWGDLHFCYFLSSSFRLISPQCFALPPWSSQRGVSNSPCVLQHCSTSALGHPSVSERLLFLQPRAAVGNCQQSWCNVASSWCATTAWNETSHSCSLKHLKWHL